MIKHSTAIVNVSRGNFRPQTLARTTATASSHTLNLLEQNTQPCNPSQRQPPRSGSSSTAHCLFMFILAPRFAELCTQQNHIVRHTGTAGPDLAARNWLILVRCIFEIGELVAVCSAVQCVFDSR